MLSGAIFYSSVLLILFSISGRGQAAIYDDNKSAVLLTSSLDSCARTQADSGFSGVVLVARGGQILLHRAYDRQGKNIDTSMAFWLASNSKQFTAAAILRLQEQGKLALYDPITRFFKKVPLDKQDITVHHLLSHTSGLGHNYIAEGILDRDEAVRLILAAPLEKPVGSQVYSSDAYCLLAAVIEIASGETYEQYMREQLFRPAGMKKTGFWGFEKDIPIRIAAAHDSIRTRPFYAKTYRNGSTCANWGCRGGGGIFSTASDLYRWIRALEGGRVLGDSSLKLLFKPYSLIRQDPGAAVSYGYGWIVATADGKRIEARFSGREDWLANSFIRDFANGDVVITLACDFGPDSPGMSTLVAKDLANILKKGSKR